MGGKKPLRRPLWPPTRATASNYYPLGLDGAGGAAKPLLRAPKKPAPLHGRLPAFSGAVDAFERARKCFLEWRYFFSIILSEFLKNRVALHPQSPGLANLLMKYLSVQREKSRKYSQSWQRQHAADELKTVAKAVRLSFRAWHFHPCGAGRYPFLCQRPSRRYPGGHENRREAHERIAKAD